MEFLNINALTHRNAEFNIKINVEWIRVSTFPAQVTTGNERVCVRLENSTGVQSLRDRTESMTLARLTAEPFVVLTRGSVTIIVLMLNSDLAA